MAMIFIPELKPIPPGATMEVRRQMYEDYCAELRRMNPHMYNADGTPKSWWQVLLGIFQ